MGNHGLNLGPSKPFNFLPSLLMWWVLLTVQKLLGTLERTLGRLPKLLWKSLLAMWWLLSLQAGFGPILPPLLRGCNR